MDASVQLLRELAEAHGVSGSEGPVRRVMAERLGPVGELSTDGLGSLICRLDGRSPEPKVMLAAHMDEVGFMVKSIDDEGFVRFSTLGGWRAQVVLGMRVWINGRNGDVPGVVGATSPHLLQPGNRDELRPLRDLHIDVGARDREEAEDVFGLRPGQPITPDGPVLPMGNSDLLLGKAWDNRVVCAAMIEAMEALAGNPPPNTVYGVGTVQEEVGLRGAVTTGRSIQPDVAIAVDIGLASDHPGPAAGKDGVALGKGPVLLVVDARHVAHAGLVDLVAETAEQEEIPLQYGTMERGATDAGSIHIQGEGIPAVCLGVPARYVHSPSSIIHLQDYRACVRLLEAVVRRLDVETVAELRRYL